VSISVDRELTLGVLFKGRVDATFTAAVNELKTAMSNVSGAAGGAGAAAGKAGKPISRMGDEFSNVGKRIGQVVGGFQRLTQAMKVTASYGLAATVIFGFINTLRKGSAAIIDYSQTLKNLQAITGATDAEIGALGTEILKVAANTKYSANEVGEAAILLGQAGFTAAETLASIGAVANLATGTLSNMADVADLMTTTIRAFGMEASDSTEIADVFAVAVNKSKLSIDKLRTSFNYLGPIANQVGLDLKETAAGAMILANAGFKASTIGTGFRQVLARLANPSEKLKTIFKAAGADLDKLNPATNDFRDVLMELEKVLGKNVAAADKARLAFALFGLRGSAAASALAQAGVEGYDKMAEYLRKVGAAQDMASKQMEGLGVMSKNLKDKLTNLAIALGEGGIAGAFETLLKVLRPFVDILIYMANTIFGKWVVMLTSMTTALLLSRIALKYVLVELSALSFGYSIATIKAMIAAKSQNTLNVAWTAGGVAIRKLWTAIMANKMIALIAGIAAVVSMLIMWKRNAEQAKQKIEEQTIATNSSVIALEKYRNRIREATEAGKSSSEIIERLIREYPELTKYVNIATMAFKDEGKALDDLIKLRRGEGIASLIYLANEAGKSAEESKRRAERIKDEGLMIAEGFLEQGDATVLVEKATREANFHLAKQEMFIEQIADALSKDGIPLTASYEEILKKLSGTAKETTPVIQHMAKTISRIFSERSTEALESFYVAPDRGIQLIKGMGEEWEKYYNTLDNRTKRNLLLFRESLDKKIEDMREAAKKAGIDFGTTQEDEARERGLTEFKLKEKEKVYAKKDALDKIDQIVLESQRRELESDLSSSRKKFENEERTLYKMRALKEISDRQYFDSKKKLEESAEREAWQIRFKYALKRTDMKEVTNTEGLEDFYTTKGELQLKDEVVEDKVNQRKVKNWERMYKLGEISAREYREEIEKAHDANILSDEDYERQIASTQEGLKAFASGVKQANAETKSWGQTWYEVGLKVQDIIATNMTGELFDFIDGTKSATEAMQDFGRNTVRWLAEIIVKQQILNGLKGISAGTSWAALFAGVGHTGGIVGQTSLPQRVVDPNIFSGAKRYGTGGIVGKDEYPIIAHRNEGIFTPAQMKALGGNQNIKIEMINKSDTPLKASSGQPRFDMGQMILNVVLEGTSRNKGGFKDQMRGALSG
jgi:TP901 family phage tail tape measure protein